MKLTDLHTFKKGREVEKMIASILQAKGYHVIPSYDYNSNGKAPKLHGLDSELVIPDLDISQNGERLWVEVKSKVKADFTYITKKLEHGIPLRLYKHYQKVEDITGCPVYLYIYEESTHIVLEQKLMNLTTRYYLGNKMSKGGMVFFPRDEFNELGFYFGGKLLTKDEVLKIRKAIVDSKLEEANLKVNNMFRLDCDLSEIVTIRDFED